MTTEPLTSDELCPTCQHPKRAHFNQGGGKLICLSTDECPCVHQLCEDCPPLGYPTDKTRCLPCPRRQAATPGATVKGEPSVGLGAEGSRPRELLTSNEQLPTWEACADKRNSGKSLTALEEFIFDNEPAPNPRSTEEEDFRTQLLAVLIEQRTARETRAIPARSYPGDEEAVRQSGVRLPYCTCSRGSDDPHKDNCKFWAGILAARTLWMDRNVTAWSCRQEASGHERCSQWCGHPEFCTAVGTDRRAQKAHELKATEQANTPRFTPAIEAEGMAWWNSLTVTQRDHWLKQAGSAAPADAWQAFRTSQRISDIQWPPNSRWYCPNRQCAWKGTGIELANNVCPKCGNACEMDTTPAPDTETSLAQYVNRTDKGSRVLREYQDLLARAAQNGGEQHG